MTMHRRLFDTLVYGIVPAAIGFVGASIIVERFAQ